ncbi:hypothetical protein V2H45_07485 [Tumidithrix elongata RA019]|uniref:Uncharacterized protein n=1 Tax=Tumidithrix elongata BACA0141 TaxID=2716417 RepID=A0AAW9PUY4_9CYAN|nr:hypothetical protein [Tumidithrix elongata RA019]
MNTHQQIQQIATTDAQLDRAIAFTPIRKSKDLNHLQRRQQQRAISNDMIRVAIAYGQKHFDRRGAIVYTLGDRQLKQSPYARFTDTLRGLQVICLQGLSTPQILTTYWNFDTKRRVRK